MHELISQAASLFAANDFFRSTTCVYNCAALTTRSAFCLLIAGTPLFRNLGIPAGCSLCAGLITGITPGCASHRRWRRADDPPDFALFFFGAKLRARSKFAVSEDVGASQDENGGSQLEAGKPEKAPQENSPAKAQ